jgi:predicted SAM-dependent methyltransferase
MVLADYSSRVCRWLSTYLAGRGPYSIHELRGPTLPMIADESVDVVVAYGVFEHIGFDDAGWFLEEFHRVLKSGGVAAFNFDDIMLRDGMAWYRANRGKPGDRCLFRFHHPAVIARLAEAAGFLVEELTEGGRTADIRLRKRR